MADRTLRRGSTLLELIVVLIVVGILLTVVLPQMTGGRGASRDRRAQATAEAVLDVEVALWRDFGEFRTGADLAAANPEIGVIDGAVSSTDPNDASVHVDGTVVAVAVGAEEGCWMVRRDFQAATDDPIPALVFGFRFGPPDAGCAGLDAAGLTGAGGTGGSWSEPQRLTPNEAPAGP